MICCNCKKDKLPEEFAIDKTNNRGRSHTCKNCKAEYKKEYRKREHVLMKQKIHSKNYHEKIKENNKYKILKRKLDRLQHRIEQAHRKNIQDTINQFHKYYNWPLVYRQCNKCGKIKNIDQFEKDRIRKDGTQRYRTQCKQCELPIHLKAVKKLKQTEHYKQWNKIYSQQPHRKYDFKLRVIKRRELSRAIGETRLGVNDILFIYNQFNNKCFRCGSDIKLNIDHHYPLSKGNPLTRNNAVLLCRKCNNLKYNKDPEEFYSFLQILELTIIYNKTFKV